MGRALEQNPAAARAMVGSGWEVASHGWRWIDYGELSEAEEREHLRRSIAAIENRLPAAVTVEVAFKKPVFLPGTVAYAARQDGAGWTFALTSPKDGSPHLLGRTTPA